MKSIKIGSSVKWTSQSQGYELAKEGVVVAVVPPDTNPVAVAPAGSKLSMTGLPRNHESYLVQAGKRLYWPRVSALEIKAKRNTPPR